MIMTLEEYIKNPMGKNNAVFSQKDMYRDLYTKKFDAVIAREAGRINYRLYKDNDKRYLMHLKIPSEVVSKFYYDVVLEFTTTDAAIAAQNSLKNYEVKFFSNDPAFVFTHAYSFAQNKLFIEDLKPKMSKKALNDKAEVRNPQNIVGYVKSIYFAYLFITLRGLDKKVTWLSEGVTYNKNDLLNFVEDADKKVADRIALGEEAEKAKAKKKKDEKKPIGNNNTFSGRSTVKTVPTISASKSSSKSTSKLVKQSKTIKRK